MVKQQKIQQAINDCTERSGVCEFDLFVHLMKTFLRIPYDSHSIHRVKLSFRAGDLADAVENEQERHIDFKGMKGRQ